MRWFDYGAILYAHACDDDELTAVVIVGDVVVVEVMLWQGGWDRYNTISVVLHRRSSASSPRIPIRK